MVNRFLRTLTLVLVALKLRQDEGEELTRREYEHLDAALGDALRPDGSTDLERLKGQSHYFDLDAWRDKDTRERTPVASPHHP